MSSSQQTTNLGLPIYGDSDVPNWKDTNTPFQTLDDIIGQGGGGSNVVPLLDFDNAIALTSTAIITTKDGCVIGGADGQNSSIIVIINGKNCNHYDSSGRVYFVNIPNIPSGSTIKLSRNNSGNFMWFVPYKYQAVDPVINVYNEAEVELNYTTPLHNFSTGNLTYTASKTCWLCGYLSASQNTTNNITINGKMYAWVTGGNANYTENSMFIPPLRINRGDTVTVVQNTPDLHILDGTISGSVGNLIGGNPTLNYASPLHVFSGTGNLSWTATKDCYLMGSIAKYENGFRTLAIDGATVAYSLCQPWSTTSIDSYVAIGGDISYIKVAKGQTVTINVDAPNLGAYEVL